MILLVNQHIVPLFVDVANAFSTNGHKTTLFAGHVELGMAPLSAQVKKISSVRYNRRSTITRFASWMFFSIHYFFYLLFCRKPAHVVVTTNPPMAPFVTALVSAVRNIKFHIVVFDLYPEALKQVGFVPEGGWLYRLWQRNNQWTFKRAQGVITLSESLKEAVSRYTSPEKVKIIFNWADTDYIKPIKKTENPFIAKYKLESKFVVMYAGNMGLTHDLESIVHAAKIIENNQQVKIILIGEGGKRKKLEDIKKRLRLDNVLFLPFQDAGTFPMAMAAADVGIVTLGTGAEGISVPSKTYINMAAGVALIAISPADSELNRIVNHYSIGHTVLPGQAEELAHLILSLASNPIELAAFKERSRMASLNFSSKNALQYVKFTTCSTEDLSDAR